MNVYTHIPHLPTTHTHSLPSLKSFISFINLHASFLSLSFSTIVPFFLRVILLSHHCPVKAAEGVTLPVLLCLPYACVCSHYCTNLGERGICTRDGILSLCQTRHSCPRLSAFQFAVLFSCVLLDRNACISNFQSLFSAEGKPLQYACRARTNAPNWKQESEENGSGKGEGGRGGGGSSMHSSVGDEDNETVAAGGGNNNRASSPPSAATAEEIANLSAEVRVEGCSAFWRIGKFRNNFPCGSAVVRGSRGNFLCVRPRIAPIPYLSKPYFR